MVMHTYLFHTLRCQCHCPTENGALNTADGGRGCDIKAETVSAQTASIATHGIIISAYVAQHTRLIVRHLRTYSAQ